MSVKTYKKYGLFSALAMVVGSVVGIGIFIKNDSIFEATDGNGVATLLAWIFGAIVSLLTALSFAEITKAGTDSNGGLSKYATVYVSTWFGRFLKVIYPILYFGILQVALAYYTYLFFMQAFATNGMADATLIGATITVVAVVPITIIVNRMYSLFSKNIMGVSLILKFIPLTLAALIGLWVSNNGGGIVTDLPGYEHSIGTFDGMLIALPSVLFAFDAFVGVGTIAKDIENPKKTMPIAVGGGMLFVSIIYVMITISQLQQNAGSVSEAIATVIGSDALTAVVDVVIVVSAVGTYSAMSIAGSSSMQDSVENNAVPFSTKILSTYGKHSGAIVNAIVTSCIGTILMTLTLSFGKGQGDMINALSNMPTLFFFVIYSIIIIGYAKVQIQLGERGFRSIYLITISLVASASIMLIVGYQFYSLIDGIIENGFIHPKIIDGTQVADIDWNSFANSLSLILFPVLMYLLPAIIIFIKQRYEYKNKFKNSLTRALRLKFM